MVFLLNNMYTQTQDMNDVDYSIIKELCSFTHTEFSYRWTCLKCNKPTIKWINKKPYCNICEQFCNFNAIKKKNKPNFVELNYFDDNQFPTGFFSRIAKEFLERGLKFHWTDNREPPLVKQITTVLPQLRYYQVDASNILIEKSRGIASMPTRSGKTYVIMDIVRKLGLKSLIIVPNLNLLHQTYKLFKRYFEPNTIGIIGDSIFEPNKIIISTIQTLNSRISTLSIRDILKETQLLIIDEAHHINFSKKNGEHNEYNTWMNICMQTNAYYRFGFTATPGKPNDLELALLEATTGSIQYDISLEKLVKEGYILQPKVLVYKFEHNSIKYTDSKKVKHTEWKDWQQAEKMGITHNYRRSHFIATLAKNYVRGSGKNLLILVDKIKHGEFIREYLPDNCLYLDGKSSSAERKRVLMEFERTDREFGYPSGSILVTTLFKEGQTIIFNGLLLASSFSKERKVIQACGRVLNIAGKTGEIIDIYDIDSSTLEKRYKLRQRIYKKEKFIVEVKEQI